MSPVVITLIATLVGLAAVLAGALVAVLVMTRRRKEKTESSATVTGQMLSKHGPVAVELLPTPPAQLESGLATPQPKPEAILISVGDLTLGEIRPYDGRATGWASVQDRRIGQTIESIVRGAPLAALGVHQAAGGLCHLKLTAEASAHLASGSWSFMKAADGGFRLNLVDGGNRIVDQAGFVPLGGAARAAGAALAVWQVLAVITAQKFLSDINKRLAEIEAGISDLRATLEENRRGTLVGNFQYLRHIAESLSSEVPSEVETQLFVGQLEHIDRECQQIEGASSASAARFAGEFNSFDLTGTGSFDDDVAKVHKNLGEFEVAAQTRLLALRVRGVACQLRAALPVGVGTTLLRARDVTRSLAEAESSHNSYLERVRLRSGELRGRFTFDSTDAREQRKMREAHRLLQGTLDESTAPLVKAAATVEAEVARLSKGQGSPVEFLVSVDPSGRVSQVQQRIAG
ncbi:hypothetical protein L6V77_03315 [Myxococcota bacterium]|nr:hypothetical protein [Myxococcota bacterium]